MIQRELMASTSFKFHHFPTFHPLDEYEKAIDSYVSEILGEDIKAIYQIGKVSVPGISDVDLMLVLECGAEKVLDFRSLSICRFDETTRYLFLHEPLIFNMRLASNINRWGYYEDEQVKRIYGEEVVMLHLPLEERKAVLCTILVENLILTYPRRLIRMLLSKDVHVRATLCHINTLRYMVKMFEYAVGWIDERWCSLEDFALFRQNWFKIDVKRQQEEIVQFMFGAVDIIFLLIQEISRYLSQSGQVAVPKNKQCSSMAGYWDRQTLTIFTDQWSFEHRYEMIEKLYERTGRCVIPLPWNMQYLLLVYASCPGSVSNYVANFVRGLVDDCTVEVGLRKASLARMQLLNEHFDFLRGNYLLHPGSNRVSFGQPVDHTWLRRLVRPVKSVYRRLASHFDQVSLQKVGMQIPSSPE